MNELHKLELSLKKFFDNFPIHLPKGARVWIASNAWWIVIAGIVLSIFSLIASLKALLWAESAVKEYQELAATYGVTTDTGSAATSELSLGVSLVALVVVLAIEIKSINLLKDRKKSGWDLIFLATLVSIAGSLISGFIAGSVISTIFGAALGALISGFFLFETREEFFPGSRQSVKTVK